jgi:hypothetical protein
MHSISRESHPTFEATFKNMAHPSIHPAINDVPDALTPSSLTQHSVKASSFFFFCHSDIHPSIYVASPL